MSIRKPKITAKLRILGKSLFIDIIAASYLCPRRIRCFLYKAYGMEVHSSAIRAQCYFASNKVCVGKGVFINHGCSFHNSGESVILQDNVWVAMGVCFTTSTHEIGSSCQRAGQPLSRPIDVGIGCWIGANATILPGVTIGDGCVIGSGAVVNKNCEPNGLYAGVPARRIKDLEYQVTRV